jgi:hypothetical protein
MKVSLLTASRVPPGPRVQPSSADCLAALVSTCAHGRPTEGYCSNSNYRCLHVHRRMSSTVILATAGYDHKIRFWEAPTGACTRSIRYPDSQVTDSMRRWTARPLIVCISRFPTPSPTPPSGQLPADNTRHTVHRGGRQPIHPSLRGGWQCQPKPGEWGVRASLPTFTDGTTASCCSPEIQHYRRHVSVMVCRTKRRHMCHMPRQTPT